MNDFFFNKMNDFNIIPDFINNRGKTYPFDIDQYINMKLENFKNEGTNKYTQQYLSEKIQKLSKTLKYEKDFHDKWKNKMINSLMDCINNKQHQCTITIPLYGPDCRYENQEETMLKHALNNFFYVLKIKGYEYTEHDSKKTVCDAMEGNCIECDKIININLK